MADSSESWEVASQESLVIVPKKTPQPRVPYRTIKLRMLHQMLYIIELMRKARCYPVSNELNEYEIFKQLRERTVGLRTNTFRGFYQSLRPRTDGPGVETSSASPAKTQQNSLETNIDLFVGLIHNNISARLYFVVGDSMDAFVEYQLGHKIIEHRNLYDGNVFSFDQNGKIRDQTVIFSKKQSYFRIYSDILRFTNSALCALERNGAISDGDCMSPFAKARPMEKADGGSTAHSQAETPPGATGNEIAPDVWAGLDDQRLSKIPIHLNKLKIHPLYVTESLCRSKEIIYPKGRVCGHVNKERVYLRKNLQKIKTERGWYYSGRVVRRHDGKADPGESVSSKCGTSHERPWEPVVKPYRIVAGAKLYAEFQTQPISRSGLSGQLMDAFHENFVPENCVYIDACSDICRILNIRHSDCIVGFRHKERVVKGFFVCKKDCTAVNEALKEQEHYQRLEHFSQKYERAVRDWRILIKKMDLYLKIKEHIGTD